MKITDFGLWYKYNYGRYEWTATISNDSLGFDIFYDGRWLGYQYKDTIDSIYKTYIHGNPKYSHYQLELRLKKHFPQTTDGNGLFTLDRPLTLNDFEIIINPHNTT